MSILEKLETLGITLPNPATPVADYVPCKQVNKLLYVSGQLPSVAGEVLYTGKVGELQTTQNGQDAARICAINTLAAIHQFTALENVAQIVKIQVYVNCTTDYTDASLVANGASQLFGQVFGDNGKHTRTAIGVAALPKGSTVEIDAIVELK